jgi:hypothetical protein
MDYARRVRKGINAELLNNRSYEGTQRGGGKAQAVFDPNGDLFVSVRAAARDKGLDVGTICHYLKHSARYGWRYANADQQAKRQAPNSCCALCHKHGSKRELTHWRHVPSGAPANTNSHPELDRVCQVYPQLDSLE